MPSYTLQDQAFNGTRKTGNPLIHYPETCKEQPTDQTDFNRFMVEMDSTFRDFLTQAHVRHSHDDVLEVFRLHRESIAPSKNVPQWQMWSFGQGKFDYGKWLLHWQFRPFVSEDRKLLSALADLENAKELKRLESQRVEEVVIIVDDSSSEPTELPSEPVPVIPPEPPTDQAKLQAEIDRLKKENHELHLKLVEERNAACKALEQERQEYDRRYNESWQWEISKSRALDPFKHPPKFKYVPRNPPPLKVIK